MKSVIFGSVLAATMASFGAVGTPTITTVEASAADKNIKVTYALGGDEDAVVTVKAYIVGEAGDTAVTAANIVGEVAKEVAPGSGKVFYWVPQGDIDPAVYAAGAIKFELKAWSMATPPQYMAFRTTCTSVIRYYPDAQSVPGGVTDKRWKTDYVLLTKIPMKNVEWRRGAASTDFCWGAGELQSYTHYDLEYLTGDHDFYIAVYETTQAQALALGFGNGSGTNKSSWDSLPNSSHYEAHKSDWSLHPVENTSHFVAHRDVGKIATATGLLFRLPTAEEWEFAARGKYGTSVYGPKGDFSDGGRNNPTYIAPVGWNYQAMDGLYGAQGVGRPHYADSVQVGQKAPNLFGTYDMIGNVREITSTPSGDNWVVKGGQMHMSGEGLGAGYYELVGNDVCDMNMGYRIACEIPVKAAE